MNAKRLYFGIAAAALALVAAAFAFMRPMTAASVRCSGTCSAYKAVGEDYWLIFADGAGYLVIGQTAYVTNGRLLRTPAIAWLPRSSPKVRLDGTVAKLDRYNAHLALKDGTRTFTTLHNVPVALPE